MEKQEIITAINPIKSELMYLLRELESHAKTKTASKELDSIIGRLEHWQHKWKYNFDRAK